MEPTFDENVAENVELMGEELTDFMDRIENLISTNIDVQIFSQEKPTIGDRCSAIKAALQVILTVRDCEDKHSKSIIKQNAVIIRQNVRSITKLIEADLMHIVTDDISRSRK